MSEWQGGKVAGCVSFNRRGNGYVVDFKIGEEVFSEWFYVKNYKTKEDALETARTYQRLISDKKQWTKNQWKISGDIVEMKADKGKSIFFDKRHLSSVEPITWTAVENHTNYYARGRIDKKGDKKVMMHRLFHPEWKNIDHIGKV